MESGLGGHLLHVLLFGRGDHGHGVAAAAVALAFVGVRDRVITKKAPPSS